MSYLIPRDYQKSIQSENLSQIIGSDSSILSAAEFTAIEEANSYLVQKYDTSLEFTDTPKWDISVMQKAGDRVYLDGPLFNIANNYNTGVIITINGKEYKAKEVIAPGAFDPTKWDLLCDQYQIYYVAYPHPVFDYKTQYIRGSQVYYKGYVYTSTSQTGGYDHADYLQLGNVTGQPSGNVFPDDPRWAQYWANRTAYTLPAAVTITDPRWIMGDNRSQQLLTYVIDITLYHVHSRIAPRNIPELRIKRYDDAKKWLRMCGEGAVTANLPVLQPKSGGRIRFGGNVKQQNSY